ncbi:MAG: TOBE domain-containing protein, partial [Thermodesulfobacteriota bacterium]|nr:TOBE domain-containing protein [Thermodesulfobacteriota bacterium]
QFPSSMRNNHSGIVTRVENHGIYYEVGVRIDDVFFKSLITKGALIDLALESGDRACISFKTSAVHVFQLS